LLGLNLPEELKLEILIQCASRVKGVKDEFEDEVLSQPTPELVEAMKNQTFSYDNGTEVIEQSLAEGVVIYHEYGDFDPEERKEIEEMYRTEGFQVRKVEGETGPQYELTLRPVSYMYSSSELRGMLLDEIRNRSSEGIKQMEVGGLRGYPQGSPSSPVLSLMSMPKVFFENPDFHSYADDFVVMSRKRYLEVELINKIELNLCGVKVNREKSGLVKQDGR